jgi:hypothetical protein
MGTNLRNFFNHFLEHADQTTAHLWKYTEYETKFGYRRELALFSSAMIIESPSAQGPAEYSLLVIDTQEQRLYQHMSYLLYYFAPYYLAEHEQIEVRLHGNSYQAIVTLEPKGHFEVESVTATGTLEKIDRFGNSKEVEKSRVNKVRFSRNPKVTP